MQVFKDIFRFISPLVLDLFPDVPLLLEMFFEFLEWINMALALCHTEESLRKVYKKYKRWLQLAVWVLGERAVSERIKAHTPKHLAWIVMMLASDPFGAKFPLPHHPHPPSPSPPPEHRM